MSNLEKNDIFWKNIRPGKFDPYVFKLTILLQLIKVRLTNFSGQVLLEDCLVRHHYFSQALVGLEGRGVISICSRRGVLG